MVVSAPRRSAVLAESSAAFPPPMTMVLPISCCLPMETFFKNSRQSIRFSLPSIFNITGAWHPMANITAEYPSSSSSRGFSTLSPAHISTPRFTMSLISLLTMFFGNLKSGIPQVKSPPGSFPSSNTVTGNPASVRSTAAVSPAGPLPIIATLFSYFFETSFI